MQVEPVTLSGRAIRLEPLTLGHVPALARVGLEPELWRLQPVPIETIDDMREYVANALDEQRRGAGLPFAIVDQATGDPIGSTRYFEIAPQHRRLEIGATWVTSAHQRTGANTEAKLLLLTYAFEQLDALRVVFKTASGRRRDMVYFAILAEEWPEVKTRLTSLLR